MSPCEVEAVMRLLAVNYDKDLSANPTMVDLWYEVLAPYDGAAVREAALRHMARSPWWPKLSDLLTPLAQTGQLEEDEAWAAVLGEVRRVGYYGVPVFPDPLVADTVARIGWRAICESDAPDVIRAQFRQFYRQARDRATTRQALQVLAGGAVRPRLLGGGTDDAPHKQPRDGQASGDSV